MSHGKAVWRRLRFFFTGHQPSCQRGPFLGFVLTPCPVLFFSCFSATPQFHSPVIFSGIRFPVSSHQVGPSGEIVGPIHFCFACASLWHQFVSLPGVFRIESSSVSSKKNFIHSFSSCSLFERWGQYIDFFAVACTYTLSGATKIQDAQKGLLETLWCVWSASCFQVYSAQFFFGSSGRMQDLTVENLRMCNSWKWHDSYRVFL